jgi:hypothetical protein
MYLILQFKWRRRRVSLTKGIGEYYPKYKFK